MIYNKKNSLILIFLNSILPCFGADLIDIYKISEKNDPLVAEAREVYRAAQEELPISRSQLLPQLNLSASRGFTKVERVVTPVKYHYRMYDLRLDQVIFDWAKWSTYLRSEPLITAAEKTLYNANQDLILRVSQAYFNLLAAQDDAEFALKQYNATYELHQQAKARLDVGDVTIADVEQVKANLDAMNAEVIRTKNVIINNQEKLREITNHSIPDLAKIKPNFSLPDLKPQSLDEWYNIANKYNLDMQVANAERLAACRDIDIAEAGYYPTANFTAKLRGSDARNVRESPTSLRRKFTNTLYLNVEVSSPNLNPYGTIAKTDQARALYHQADAAYIEAYRKAQTMISKYYRDVMSTKNQISALQQAVKAAQTALDANRANFEVGEREYVIVLERLGDLYRAKRDHKMAVYRYLMSWLQLENASGRLDIRDLAVVNSVLEKTTRDKTSVKPIKTAAKTQKAAKTA